jgi:hypothetical protein
MFERAALLAARSSRQRRSVSPPPTSCCAPIDALAEGMAHVDADLNLNVNAVRPGVFSWGGRANFGPGLDREDGRLSNTPPSRATWTSAAIPFESQIAGFSARALAAPPPSPNTTATVLPGRDVRVLVDKLTSSTHSAGRFARMGCSSHLDPNRASDHHPYGHRIKHVVEATRRQRCLGGLADHPPGRPVDMRQLVDESRRDRAGCIGRLKQPRRNRDILLERDPKETWVRVGIKANKDVRVSPDGGEVPTARQLGKGTVAALSGCPCPRRLCC